jgi:hypothetical protein
MVWWLRIHTVYSASNGTVSHLLPQASRRWHITSHGGNLRRAPNDATSTNPARPRLLMKYRGLRVRYCGDYRWLTQGRSYLRWRAAPPRSFNSGEKIWVHRLFPLPGSASDNSPRRWRTLLGHTPRTGTCHRRPTHSPTVSLSHHDGAFG